MSNTDYGEPFINEDLYKRVDWLMEDTLLHDETYKTWEKADPEQQEKMHLSELKRLFDGMTKSDFAVAVIVALENYPYMVLQCVAEYITRKGTDHGRNN